MENISQDINSKKIRDRLNAEKIKLWLPPYTTEDKEKGDAPKDIIDAYSKDFGLDKNLVAQLLEELRLHALSKLAERDKFMTQGLATLRIKVTCPLPAESSTRKPFPVVCQLSLLGSELKALIASTRNNELSPDLLKLICKGRVLDETSSLEEQGVKHGSDIMAMCMTASEASGQPVNVEAYNSLVAMEYSKGASAEALRQCNNDISMAIEYLHTHPELFSLPDPDDRKINITDEMIRQVTALGFDESLARRALQHFQGRMERAVEELLASGGILPPPLPMSASSSFSSSSSTDSSLSESSGDELSKKRKKKEEAEELESLVSDINPDTNDHLDLTLSDEREILSTYQGMATSLQQGQQLQHQPSSSSSSS